MSEYWMKGFENVIFIMYDSRYMKRGVLIIFFLLISLEWNGIIFILVLFIECVGL